jgi:tetratricopeptide (TPR) repeat protein
MSETKSNRAVWGVLLVLVIGAAYARLWTNGFVAYDDQEYLLENPHVSSGLSLANVAWAFTHAYAANWHPLTWLAHMLDVELFGLDPRGHHAVDLAFHAANAWLVFAFLVRAGARPLSAWLGAALFALHPLRVESVAWASELKDVLGAFFALLALHAWASWVERRGAWRYALAAALFACGLAAKPTVVTLPFALLLLDAWPFARLGAQSAVARVVEKLPLFALAALASAATVWAQDAGSALAWSEDFPLAGRLANALHAYRTYLVQTVWPSGLVPFYPYAARDFLDPSVLKGAAALGLFTFLAWRVRARRPWFVVAWAWFLGTLVPMLGLVQVGGQSHADRYTYLPHVALAVAFAFAVEELRALRPRLVAALSVTLLAACGLATFAQVGRWRDSETLFRHALAHTERNYVMENALANELIEHGRAEEAFALLERTVREYPEFRKGRYNHVRALAELGRFDAARAACDDWLAHVPTDVGFVAALVEARLRDGDVDAAEEDAQRVFAVDPGALELRRELGLALVLAGRAEAGYQALAFAAALRPSDAKLAREAEGARQLAREADALGDAGRELCGELARRALALAERHERRGRSDAARAARERASELDARGR